MRWKLMRVDFFYTHVREIGSQSETLSYVDIARIYHMPEYAFIISTCFQYQLSARSQL